MKLVTAYIQRFMMEKVTDALRVQKIHGVTVVQCEGFGRMIGGKKPQYRDVEAELGYAPKIMINIVCRDEEMLSIIQTIMENAHTGRYGDGKIFVTEVTHAFDIRTGEEGVAVL